MSSNLVEACQEYMPAIPKDNAALVSAFLLGGGRKGSLVRELTETGSTKAGARRMIERWRTSAKQKRNPAKIRKETADKLRGILIARHFPVKITVHGRIGYNAKDMRERTFHVAPITYDDMVDLLAIADAADKALEVNGEYVESGEEAACNVFTGWYFGAPAEPLVIGGKEIATQPYDSTLVYEQAEFTIERLPKSADRRQRAA